MRSRQRDVGLASWGLERCYLRPLWFRGASKLCVHYIEDPVTPSSAWSGTDDLVPWESRGVTPVECTDTDVDADTEVDVTGCPFCWI